MLKSLREIRSDCKKQTAKIRVILLAAICAENHANNPGVNVLSATYIVAVTTASKL